MYDYLQAWANAKMDEFERYQPRPSSRVCLNQQLRRLSTIALPIGFQRRGYLNRQQRRQRYFRETMHLLELLGLEDVDADDFIAACRRKDEDGGINRKSQPTLVLLHSYNFFMKYPIGFATFFNKLYMNYT